MKDDTVNNSASSAPLRLKTTGTSDALAFFYGLWAFSALGRAVYQYGFKHPANFTPTHISTFVGVLYIAIIVGLRRRSPRAWWVTLTLLCIELAGVLVVGTIDVVWHPFAYASVWSGYGIGYFFMPLVLPFVGLAWMLRKETRAAYWQSAAVSSRQSAVGSK